VPDGSIQYKPSSSTPAESRSAQLAPGQSDSPSLSAHGSGDVLLLSLLLLLPPLLVWVVLL
jgi:hypothetical protein